METQKAKAAFAHTSVTVDLAQPGHYELLKKAYNEIYVDAFPDINEREELEIWVSKLKNKAQSASDSYAIILAGDNLDDPANAYIKGIAVGIYYDDAQSGLMAYNAIRPECQRQGLGRFLVNERIKAFEGVSKSKGHDLKAIFLEVNNPDKVETCGDSMDPKLRKATFEAWGARTVDVDYVQPALSTDKGKCKELMLMAYPVNSAYPTPKITEHFLHALYEGHGHKPPEQDEDYRNMVAELRRQQPALALAA